MKRRFQILLLMPEYNLTVQAWIPAALCSVHNFIQTYDLDEGDLPVEVPPLIEHSTTTHDGHQVIDPGDEGTRELREFRDMQWQCGRITSAFSENMQWSMRTPTLILRSLRLVKCHGIYCSRFMCQFLFEIHKPLHILQTT